MGRNTWTMGPQVSVVDDPSSIEDRLCNARRFQQEVALEVPLYVDGINNAFEEAYAAWPERFYVLVEGRVAWIAQPKKGALHPSEVKIWLAAYENFWPHLEHSESDSSLTKLLSMFNLLIEFICQDRSCQDVEEMLHEHSFDTEARAGTMKYLGAFLMARLSGKEPTAADLVAIFEAGGISFDMRMVDLVLTRVAGRSTEDILQAGLSKLVSFHGASTGASPGAAASVDNGARSREEEQRQREVVAEEMSEEEIEFDIFG